MKECFTSSSQTQHAKHVADNTTLFPTISTATCPPSTMQLAGMAPTSTTTTNSNYGTHSSWSKGPSGNAPSTGHNLLQPIMARMPSHPQSFTNPHTFASNQGQNVFAVNQQVNASAIANTRHLMFWDFYKHDPSGWFKQLDLFIAYNVKEDEAKFNFVGRYLTQDIHHDLQYKLNTLVRGQKYEAVKKILTERYSETPEQQLDRLCKGLVISHKRPSDFLAEMLSLAQNRVQRDTVISMWKTRLLAQIQIMVMNYKVESELLKTADMTYDILQQSHKLDALKSTNQVTPAPEDIVAQTVAAVLKSLDNNNYRIRSRSNSKDKRVSSSTRSSSGSRIDK